MTPPPPAEFSEQAHAEYAPRDGGALSHALRKHAETHSHNFPHQETIMGLLEDGHPTTFSKMQIFGPDVMIGPHLRDDHFGGCSIATCHTEISGAGMAFEWKTPSPLDNDRFHKPGTKQPFKHLARTLHVHGPVEVYAPEAPYLEDGPIDTEDTTFRPTESFQGRNPLRIPERESSRSQLDMHLYFELALLYGSLLGKSPNEVLDPAWQWYDANKEKDYIVESEIGRLADQISDILEDLKLIRESTGPQSTITRYIEPAVYINLVGRPDAGKTSLAVLLTHCLNYVYESGLADSLPPGYTTTDIYAGDFVDISNNRGNLTQALYRKMKTWRSRMPVADLPAALLTELQRRIIFPERPQKRFEDHYGKRFVIPPITDVLATPAPTKLNIVDGGGFIPLERTSFINDYGRFPEGMTASELKACLAWSDKTIYIANHYDSGWLGQPYVDMPETALRRQFPQGDQPYTGKPGDQPRYHGFERYANLRALLDPKSIIPYTNLFYGAGTEYYGLGLHQTLHALHDPFYERRINQFMVSMIDTIEDTLLGKVKELERITLRIMNHLKTTHTIQSCRRCGIPGEVHDPNTLLGKLNRLKNACKSCPSFRLRTTPEIEESIEGLKISTAIDDKDLIKVA
jgi:hypothetical protein